MKSANVYLMFDGNCREAMTFYGKCMQTEPGFTPYSAVPQAVGEAAKSSPDRIMHSELAAGPVVLMASDTMPGMPFTQGHNFSIALTCESREEMDRLFAALSENGKVTMPAGEAFWGGRFGMLTDRFGISWMLTFR